MKTLTVYMGESFRKYPNLFKEFIHEVDPSGILIVYKQERGDQYEECTHAVFKNWDYYLIEEDHEI